LCGKSKWILILQKECQCGEELAKYKHDFKTNCEEDYGEIKMYLYASTQKNPNVVRFGYVFLHVCGNLLGVLQLVEHLGAITIKEPKMLLDYNENYTCTTLKNKNLLYLIR
jgi:hypothetical protein